MVERRGAERAEATEPAHAGEQLQRLRVATGMTVDAVAERAGVDAGWLRRIEAGEGTHDVLYSQWTALVRATQPPRPEWWDEGYEHDLTLPLTATGSRRPTAAGATGPGWRRWPPRSRSTTAVAEPADPTAQLEELCRVLNHYGVGYIVFGSQVARLNGCHWRRSTSTWFRGG